jgi:hypothetical protein
VGDVTRGPVRRESLGSGCSLLFYLAWLRQAAEKQT